MTTAPAPAQALDPPDWPHCIAGDSAATGDHPCRGGIVDPYDHCLAHLTDGQREEYFASLYPGAPLTHPGTRLDEQVVLQLMQAVRAPESGRPQIGPADFRSSIFTGHAWFHDAHFTENAEFKGVIFSGKTWFHEVRFTGFADFNDATFGDNASFQGTEFLRTASFRRAKFLDARFDSAVFSSHCLMTDVSARILRFQLATFKGSRRLGPLLCRKTLDLSGATFTGPVTIEAATPEVSCRRTQWISTAKLRLRYATVDLTDSVFEYPVNILSHSHPFTRMTDEQKVDETVLTGASEAVSIRSLQGVDAAHMSLTDVDLSACLFTSAVNLDQLSIEGRIPFAGVPGGIHRSHWRLVHFTPRRTLAEEQHWRSTQPGAVEGWVGAPEQTAVVGPARLAPVYRSLRKAFEDSKNEPGAADFYYGEMEMRRADKETPRSERWVLGSYWALSGYGLRASRAMGWLLTSMVTTVGLMMLWGVPAHDPTPQSTGTVTIGQPFTLRTTTPDPINPTGPLRKRLSSDRFEKSLRVMVNSVIFRSSGQNLTTAGTYIEMASRLTEPVLLGLALLAIRSRIKR